MIHLVAEVKAYPDSKDQVVNLLAGLLEPTRKEEAVANTSCISTKKLMAYLCSKKSGHRKRPWISICKARIWRRFLKHWKRMIGLNIPDSSSSIYRLMTEGCQHVGALLAAFLLDKVAESPNRWRQ